MDKHDSNLKLLTYVRALFHDWLTGMCGALSVPFTAIAVLGARAPSAKVLWGCLAVLAFLIAGYRVWRKERSDRIKDVEGLKAEITALKRKPYEDELGTQAQALIARLSPEGKTLLRHLVTNEPVEVGRRFRPEISQEVQDAQMAIAYGSGIVRHDVMRAGSGMILRTDYVVNRQFRPVLQDLLFVRK